MVRKGWKPFKSTPHARAYRYERTGGAIWLPVDGQGRGTRWRWRVEELGCPLGEEDDPEVAASRVEEAFRLRDEVEAEFEAKHA